MTKFGQIVAKYYPNLAKFGHTGLSGPWNPLNFIQDPSNSIKSTFLYANFLTINYGPSERRVPLGYTRTKSLQFLQITEAVKLQKISVVVTNSDDYINQISKCRVRQELNGHFFCVHRKKFLYLFRWRKIREKHVAICASSQPAPLQPDLKVCSFLSTSTG